VVSLGIASDIVLVEE
jgi:hypothetical protein